MTGWRPGGWLLIAAACCWRGRRLATSINRHRHLQGGTGPSSCGPPPPCCWRSPRGRHGRARRAGGSRTGGWCSVPSLSLLAALGVLIYGDLPQSADVPALILATATVLAVCVHLMITVRENLAMLAGSRRLALTDPLTGLGNRRQLMEDLQLACRAAGRASRGSWCCSTSTASSATTTPSATPPATRCWRASATSCSAVVAAHGRPTAWAATSSACCSAARPPTSSALVQAPSPPSRARPGLRDRRRARRVIIPGERRDRRPRCCSSPTSACTSQGPVARGHAGSSCATCCCRPSGARPRPAGAPARVGALVLQARAARAGRRRARRARARAAELHDVGKIAIPDAILNKPGPLDERGVAVHARAHDDRRAHPIAAPRPAPGRRARALEPRALRRRRLPRRRRRGDPARRAHHRRLRRLRRDDLRARLLPAITSRRSPSCAPAPAPSSTPLWSTCSWRRSPPRPQPQSQSQSQSQSQLWPRPQLQP